MKLPIKLAALLLLYPYSIFAVTINNQTEKTAPVAADELMIDDSADGYKTKKIQAGNLPVSTATQVALDAKQAADADLTTFAGITPSENVIAVLSAVDYSAIKVLLGIENIDNTSDADKPISTATQTALNAKQATLVSGTNIKTINSTSILGSGDIVISGGTGAVDSVNGETGVVVLDADDIDDTSTANKFVTASDITNLGNLSGTNTGDQDLSGYALKANVLELTNTTAFTPDADYEPATKKYVDDSIVAGGSYTDEQAQDAWGALLSGGTQTGISVTYNDAGGTANFVVSESDPVFMAWDKSTGISITKSQVSDFGSYAPPLGADDNYVTDAEKVVIGNTSGINTGDQDISGKANISCFADESSFNACFALDWPTGSMIWPSTAGIMVYGGLSSYGDSLTLDTDLSSVSTSDDSVPSAKATKAALDALPDITILNTATVAIGTGNVIGPGVWLLIDSDGDGVLTDELWWTTALSGYQTSLTFDSTPTASSTNPVTSGGVYSYFANYLLISAIDDTPVDSETSAPISSNWAYDHANASDPHPGYVLETAMIQSDDCSVETPTAGVICFEY